MAGLPGRLDRKDWWLQRPQIFDGRWHTVDLLVDGWPGTVAQFRSAFYRQAELAERMGETNKITATRLRVRAMNHDDEFKPKRVALREDLEFAARQAAQLEAEHAQHAAELAREAALLADACTCGSDGSTPHPPSCKVWG